MEGNIKNPLGSTLLYVALSLFMTLIGFFLGIQFIPYEVAYALNFVFLIVIIIISLVSYLIFKKRKTSRFSMWFVYLYAFIEGIIIYPIVLSYLQQLGVTIVLTIFIGTILWVMLLGIVALKSNGKFLKIGWMLLIGLIIETILIIFGVFLFNDLTMVLISAFGVLIFSGYVLYDISVIKYASEQGLIQERNDLSIYVLNVYIDIVGIFLRILRIVSYIMDKNR